MDFSMMIAQTQTLASSRISITSFTTTSACRNRPQSESEAEGAASAAVSTV